MEGMIMASNKQSPNIGDILTTYLYLFAIIIIAFKWIFSVIVFIFSLIPRLIRWLFRFPQKKKQSKVSNPIKEIAGLNVPESNIIQKSSTNENLKNLGLEDYQIELVKSGDYQPYNFEEEDMDEDDYFHDDA